MDRHLNEVFLQAREALEGLVGPHGFRVTREVFDHSTFRSASAEYRHRRHWLRLIWDGKESWLWLAGAVSRDQHTFPGDAAWHDLGSAPPPGTPALILRPGPVADARVAELLAQAAGFLDSGAAV